MSPSPPTFTGRARRRTSRPWVRAGDTVARALITVGGIGTIFAVLLVGAFLFTVALPLFRQAASQLDFDGPLPDGPPTGAAVAALGSDESALVAWLAMAGADGAVAGDVRIFSVTDGRTMHTPSAASCGLEGATALRVRGAAEPGAVGYRDGTFRVGRLGLESTFVPPDDLPAGAERLAAGDAGEFAGRILIRGATGHHAVVTLVSELGEPSRVAAEPIVDIDLAPRPEGVIVAALDAAGRVRLEAVTQRRNLLTDAIVTTSLGSTIEAEEGFLPRFVRLTELGDQLFLIAADGAARRHVIRDVEAPRLAEDFRVIPDGDAPAAVTAVERLFGGVSLAIGDAAGTVRVFFASRGGEALAADGVAMRAGRTFRARDRGAAGIRGIAASPRSRLFAVADAAGDVRLLHSTTGSEVLRPDRGSSSPADRLVIAPRENLLLAAGGGSLAAWRIDAAHPEIAAHTLLGRVWYENYPGPVHAWETTGHEAFESKFGLVPLIFGTIKATLYTMLFATPIAILAAIYASQFVHPRWRAWIKPTIELMAGLPSVVLGFIAGLVFAPLLDRHVMAVVTGLVVVPLVLLTGAHLWQMVPAGWRPRLAAWRLAVIGLVALPVGCAAAVALAPGVERLLFQGDFRGWLDGRGGSGFGGWMLALIPLSAVTSGTLVGRVVSPWLRRLTRSAPDGGGSGWTERRAAVVTFGVFIVGVLVTLAIAAAAGSLLDALRLDTRGGIFGTYVQRNALVVGLGMSFAIIPLIFTIADDALTSVPDHLRSASLGAGATPWQTAVRVIVPAAASGIFSAVMIGLGRAVGETMIVLMAAGNTPIMDWSIFNGFQTLSAAIATELPEAARGSTHYRVLFLAALALFAITFVVNTAAELVRQRFRRRAHDL